MKKGEYIQIKNQIIHALNELDDIKNYFEIDPILLNGKNYLKNSDIYIYYNIHQVMNYHFLVEK